MANQIVQHSGRSSWAGAVRMALTLDSESWVSKLKQVGQQAGETLNKAMSDALKPESIVDSDGISKALTKAIDGTTKSVNSLSKQLTKQLDTGFASVGSGIEGIRSLLEKQVEQGLQAGAESGSQAITKAVDSVKMPNLKAEYNVEELEALAETLARQLDLSASSAKQLHIELEGVKESLKSAEASWAKMNQASGIPGLEGFDASGYNQQIEELSRKLAAAELSAQNYSAKLRTVDEQLASLKATQEQQTQATETNRQAVDDATSSVEKSIEPIPRLAQEAEKLGATFEGVKGAMGGAVSAVAGFASRLGKVNVDMSRLKNLGKGLGSLLTAPFRQAVQGATGLIKRLRDLVSQNKQLASASRSAGNAMQSITRVAMGLVGIRSLYAGIRRAVRGVGEDLKHAAKQNISFRMTMDSLTRASGQLRASFSSLAIPLINAVAPAIERVSALLARAFTTATHFLGALTGQTSVLVAVGSSQTYLGDSIQRANEAYRKQVEQARAAYEAEKEQAKEAHDQANAAAQASYDKARADLKAQKEADKKAQKEAKAEAKRLKDMLKEEQQAKKLIRTLSGFDEIEILNQADEDDPLQDMLDSIPTEFPLPEYPEIEKPELPRWTWDDFIEPINPIEGIEHLMEAPLFEEVPIDSGIAGWAEKARAIFDDLLSAVQPTIDALKRLWDNLAPFREFTWNALKDFYEMFLKPVGKWVLGKGIPDLLDAFGEMMYNVDWNRLRTSLQGLWEVLTPFAIVVGEGLNAFLINTLIPLAGWTLGNGLPRLVDVLASIVGAADLERIGAGLERLSKALSPITIGMAEGVVYFFEEFVGPIGRWAMGDGFPRLIESLSRLAESIDMNKINTGFRNMWSALAPLGTLALDSVVIFFETIVEKVGAFTLNEALPRLTGLIERIALATDIDRVREGIVGLLDAIANTTVGMIDGVLAFVEGFLDPVGKFVMGEGFPKLLEIMTDMHESVDWDTINEGLGSLGESLGNLTVELMAGLLWLYENFLVPIQTWSYNELLPKFLELVGYLADWASEMLVLAQPALEWFWESFLVPLGDWAGGAIIALMDWLMDVLERFASWARENPENFERLVKIILIGVTAFLAIKAVVGIVTTVMGLFSIASGGASAAMGILTAITSPLGLAIIAIIALLIPMIAQWGDFKDALAEGRKSFKTTVDVIVEGNGRLVKSEEETTKLRKGLRDILKNATKDTVEEETNIIEEGNKAQLDYTAEYFKSMETFGQEHSERVKRAQADQDEETLTSLNSYYNDYQKVTNEGLDEVVKANEDKLSEANAVVDDLLAQNQTQQEEHWGALGSLTESSLDDQVAEIEAMVASMNAELDSGLTDATTTYDSNYKTMTSDQKRELVNQKDKLRDELVGMNVDSNELMYTRRQDLLRVLGHMNTDSEDAYGSQESVLRNAMESMTTASEIEWGKQLRSINRHFDLMTSDSKTGLGKTTSQFSFFSADVRTNMNIAESAIKNASKTIQDRMNDVVNNIRRGQEKVQDFSIGSSATGKNSGLQIRAQAFATGGIVKQPTLGLVGEAGAEAVMPLERNTGWIDKLADSIAQKGGTGGDVGGEINVTVPVYVGEGNLVDTIQIALDRRGRQLNRNPI